MEKNSRVPGVKPVKRAEVPKVPELAKPYSERGLKGVGKGGEAGMKAAIGLGEGPAAVLPKFQRALASAPARNSAALAAAKREAAAKLATKKAAKRAAPRRKG